MFVLLVKTLCFHEVKVKSDHARQNIMLAKHDSAYRRGLDKLSSLLPRAPSPSVPNELSLLSRAASSSLILSIVATAPLLCGSIGARLVSVALFLFLAAILLCVSATSWDAPSAFPSVATFSLIANGCIAGAVLTGGTLY